MQRDLDGIRNGRAHIPILAPLTSPKKRERESSLCLCHFRLPIKLLIDDTTDD